METCIFLIHVPPPLVSNEGVHHKPLTTSETPPSAMTTDPTKPRVYWIHSSPTLSPARAEMDTLLSHCTTTHIQVPACDAYRDYAGNTTRAHTLSHVRALRQMARDARGMSGHEQIALVAEDTLSCAYAKWWTEPLAKVLANAPKDWGVLQLSYTCDAHCRQQMQQVDTLRIPSSAQCAYPYEHAVFHAPAAPYLPWSDIRSSSTTLYAVHPRGYRDILNHVRAYKHDTSYPRGPVSNWWNPRRASTPRFHPDVRAAEMFALTPTYVYHVPMFSVRDAYRCGAEKEDGERMDHMMKLWHWEHIGWAGRWG